MTLKLLESIKKIFFFFFSTMSSLIISEKFQLSIIDIIFPERKRHAHIEKITPAVQLKEKPGNKLFNKGIMKTMA